MELSTLIISILTGLSAGILSGLLGVGGGTIIIPSLVFLMGVSQQTAQGISLLVIVPTAMIGAYGYFLKGKISLKTGLLLGSGAVVGSALGSLIAVNLQSGDLRRIFGVFMIVVGLKVLYDVLSGKK